MLRVLAAAAASPGEEFADGSQVDGTCSNQLPPGAKKSILLFLGGASAPKNCEKRAVIQSAASAASAKGGCANSRLDHG